TPDEGSRSCVSVEASAGPSRVNLSIRYISTTSSTVYSRTKPVRLKARSLTVSEDTDSQVGSTSPTVHGCRPTSATNQPASEAIHGSGMEYSAKRSSALLLPTVRRAEAANAQMNRTSMMKPAATITRKVQNRGPTGGMLSRTAAWICSSVASTTLSV